MQKFFGPHFFQEGRPQLLYTAGCYRELPSTVWQSLVEFCLLISVCEAWQWSGMQNLRRVGKNYRPLWSRLWTNVYVVLWWYIEDCYDCLYRVLFLRYRPLKLPLSCEVVRKGGFWAPIYRGGDTITLDFGHAFSNRSYFRACGRFWLSSVQRARRLGGEK